MKRQREVSFVHHGVRLGRTIAAGAVETIPAPDKVRLLLRQEAGPECTPLVEPGDPVIEGQRVAAGATERHADLHASISGTVQETETVSMPDGSRCAAIVIEAGPGDDAEAHEKPEHDPSPLDRSREELLERIRRGGVVQSGREARALTGLIRDAASPRAYISSTGLPVARPIRAIAVRFVDEDPHMGALAAVAHEADAEPTDLELGVQALRRITGANRAHFALDEGQALPGVEALAEAHDFPVVRVDTGRYPSASDVMIAREISGLETDVENHGVHTSGVLVIDVDVAQQVARAIRDGQGVVERALTIRGPAGSRVVRARIGTSLEQIAEAAGALASADGGLGKVVLGGPMRGLAHHVLDHPLGRDVAGLTLLRRADVQRSQNDPCVGCGLCVEVCPIRLVPGLLSRYCEFGDWRRAEEAYLFSCIECGCCGWVCPARRSLVQFIVHGKNEVLAMRRPEA